jgi:hypothetical protein
MEKLEKFILDNREAFDTEIPDLKVWAALDKQLNQTAAPTQAKVIALSSWLPKMRIAASVALLVATGISIGFYLKSNTAPPTLAEVSPEHAEMERFYQKEIEKKERLLVQVANNEAPEVKQDLQAIDQVMIELREELMNAPKGSREFIIKNMIESYKNKVDILERVLQGSQNYSNTNISKQQSNNEKDTI